MTQHVKTCRRLCELDVVSLASTLDSIPLSDIDRELMMLRYFKRHNFNYIADTLGFSESTVRKRHKNIIRRLHNKI